MASREHLLPEVTHHPQAPRKEVATRRLHRAETSRPLKVATTRRLRRVEAIPLPVATTHRLVGTRLLPGAATSRRRPPMTTAQDSVDHSFPWVPR
jgi:hypothetical protein